MNAQCGRGPFASGAALGSRSRVVRETSKLVADAPFNPIGESTGCVLTGSEATSGDVHQIGWVSAVAHPCTSSAARHSLRHSDGGSSSFHSSTVSPGALGVRRLGTPFRSPTSAVPLPFASLPRVFFRRAFPELLRLSLRSGRACASAARAWRFRRRHANSDAKEGPTWRARACCSEETEGSTADCAEERQEGQRISSAGNVRYGRGRGRGSSSRLGYERAWFTEKIWFNRGKKRSCPTRKGSSSRHQGRRTQLGRWGSRRISTRGK